MRKWLFTWNPDRFDWYNYHNECDYVRKIKVSIGRWSTRSHQMHRGDMALLMIVGQKERNGIIGVGTILGDAYEEDNVWYVGIRFEYLADYTTKDCYIPQSYLKLNMPKQNWSPQGSGISVLSQYYDELDAMIADMKDTNYYLEYDYGKDDDSKADVYIVSNKEKKKKIKPVKEKTMKRSGKFYITAAGME